MDLGTGAILASTLLKGFGSLFGGGQRPTSPYEAQLVRLLMQLSDPNRFQTLAKPYSDYMTGMGERALSRRGMFSSSGATQLQSDIGRQVGQMFMQGQQNALQGWLSLMQGTQWQKPTFGQRLAGFGGTAAGGIEDLLMWRQYQKETEQSQKLIEAILAGGS